MPRLMKHMVGILAVILVIGCSGGGCGNGCASCGLTPLAEGFDPASRIENAGSVRLTSSGLEFLQQNLGGLAKALLGSGTSGGFLTFPVPESTGTAVLVDYTICPGGADPNATPPKCTAEVDVANADLTIKTVGPHNVTVTGTLPVRLQDLPIDIDYGFVTDSTTGVLDLGGDCGATQSFAQIPLDVDISVETDQDATHSRVGYTRLKFNKLDSDQNAIEQSLTFCNGGVTTWLLNTLKPLLIGMLYDQLIGTLKGQVEGQLCQKANPMLSPTCPTGTNDVNGVCRYGTDDASECASSILGIDGHIDLSRLLATLSPGTKGGLDILFAAGGQDKRDDGSGFAWGDLNPIGGGATLGMYGGAVPQPLSQCVKTSEMELPTAIPIPDELLANEVPNWPATLPGPHVGLALSERFTNYALNGVYNSGLLCIGISTEAIPLLNSGTLKLLIPSLTTLALQKEPQQLALVVRPATPPKVAFGNGTSLETDPSLRITLPNASFDFYVWSLDRFIRFMTATFDLDVPLNLTVTPDGLKPVLKDIGVSNGKITNSALLSESEDDLIKALQGIIEQQVGAQLGNGFPAIDINASLASLGLTLTIPETVEGKGSPGLVKLTKGTDNYLGIFASLGLADPAPMMSHTSAQIGGKRVDPNGLRAGAITKDNAPVVTLHMTSTLDDGAHAVEYAYRLDEGAWHPFSRERQIDVKDGWLRLQGHHVISVRSRVVGQPMSLDPTPAKVDFVIDAEPPSVAVGEVVDGKASISVRDLVSKPEQASFRFKLDGGRWSDWMPGLANIDVGDANDITVEAKDEEGNIGTAEQALIRGRPSKDAAAACNCSLPGQPRGAAGVSWLLAAALAGIFGRLARRRAPWAPLRPALRRCLSGAALVAVCGSWAGCSCGDDDTHAAGGATYKCEAPACRALEPGLIGAYSSAAVSGNDIWIAGYLEGDWDHDNAYGDLVVGKWSGDHVDWKVIDGVPDDPPPDTKQFDNNGFRGGQSEAGADVGLWTSIAMGSDGPKVAYYDRTNKALKFASSDGKTWSVSTVETKASSDIGRYAKLLYVNDVPVIAYLVIEPGEGGATTSKIRVATGASGSPGEGQWSFEDAVVEPATPCRKPFCGSGTECVADTAMCMPALAKDKCNPACSGGEACIDPGTGPACTAVFDDAKLDAYPDAVGDYISMAVDPSGNLGIAYYDRIHGNLAIASRNAGAWSTLVVDGQAPDGTDTSDVGMGASLAIDDLGDWHITYVDGYSESLRYVRVGGGTTPGPIETLDDGLQLGGQPFDDGQHLVGDDSKVTVTGSGEVHVTYQDSTAGKLRYAVGTPGSDTHNWDVRAYDQDGFAGAFSGQVDVGGKLQLMNWWRIGGERVAGDVALIAP